MANSTTVAFHGFEDVYTFLRELPSAVRADVLKGALVKAAKPIQRAMSSMAPRRTGALKRSIAIKGVSDKTKGTAAALIGPDRNYYGGGKRLKKGADRRGADMPANYAHLVEFGHAIAVGGSLQPTYAVAMGLVTNKRGKLVRRRVRGKVVEAAKGSHAGMVKPRPFMRPGFFRGLPQAEAILYHEVENSMERVRLKIIKSGNRAA